LRNLLESRGIEPKSKLGQCFLVDLNLLDIVVQTAELTPKDLILEVGSGTGSLTNRLAEHAAGVLAVEIDGRFLDLLCETLAGRENVRVLHADALKSKNEINPEMLAALHDIQRSTGAESLKLVANLPYSVAVPLIGNLLTSELSFERMVVTVQWEIAERLVAAPSSKAYGALAVLVQSLAEVSLVRRLPASVFWPRPKVDSAIMMIRPDARKRAQVGDPMRFRRFLRDLYVHRRKNLRGALIALPNQSHEKAEVDRKLTHLGIDGAIRAETLRTDQHLQLCGLFG
jgi:16S rRNA (adenine1518-N6/adenine1519-N6)-dimethyltransferase